ncbi:MAG TPA: LuxR C-terminal-related transcriptional regulator [Microlunatus sp.]|nr:LuxR C-terminal-related transcriptional regulator [Microlunatus sp.]
MTQTIQTVDDQDITTVIDAPELPPSFVVRRRLNARLDASVAAGSLTVVRAPAGAGKTVGVAGWIREVATPRSVIWIAVDAELDQIGFWRRMRSDLLRAGSGPLPRLPASSVGEKGWDRWCGALATALCSQHRKFVVVLDDFVAPSADRFSQRLGRTLRQSHDRLRLVLIQSVRGGVEELAAETADGCTEIGPECLRMDLGEVAEMLALAGAEAGPELVSAVTERTYGWAHGVGLAAYLIREAPRRDGIALMDELDQVLDTVVDRGVLAALPAGGREVIIRTSPLPEVTPALVHGVLGRDLGDPTQLLTGGRGFIDVAEDGTFRCHPLLRRCAIRRLDREWPALARATRRELASWKLSGGDRSVGLQLAAGVDDWGWAARTMVSSLAVPAIVLGAIDHAALDDHGWSCVEQAEPLIAAARAAVRGDLYRADSALVRAGTAEEIDPVRLLSAAVVRLAVARHRADPEEGPALVEKCRELAARIPRQREQAPELATVLDTHHAAFLARSGELDKAVGLLDRPLVSMTPTLGQQLAVAGRQGLGAWLHAIRGELTLAARLAAQVLTSQPANCDGAGVGYAQLASAWIHLERGELDQAHQRLGHALSLDGGCPAGGPLEPWLVGALRLTEARLATAVGEPDVCLRLLHDLSHSPTAPEPGGWLADRCLVATAEAHLAAGDPGRALSALTPEPRSTPIEARVVAATARHAVGDRRGAKALLRGADGDVASAPLPAAVRVWAFGAQLAAEDGDDDRARRLIQRALRAAEREDLRLVLATVGPWLSAYLDHHPDLARQHRSLLASMRAAGRTSAPKTPARRRIATQALADPLTDREIEVLEWLAQLCTTEEIGVRLFVSPNTVKTHIKSLFLKLAVNRRSDAVRRGRDLGLC